MIVDGAYHSSDGHSSPQFGYGSWGGYRDIRGPSLRPFRPGLFKTAALEQKIGFYGAMVAGGIGLGMTAAGVRALRWLAPRALAAPFRPSTWAAYNFYQEAGDFASLLRGEKQTYQWEWRIRPLSLGGGALAGGVLPVPFPWLDLSPVRQEDVSEVEEAVEKITLPEVIQSPGNSSQVLPAGSVSPGGTALGWIPVITSGKKRRKLSR